MHALRIEGDPAVYDAADGETVLLALRRQGVALPSSCESGECGTCKVALVAGEVQELNYDPWALDDDLRARGIVLACRSTVWGDVTLRRLRALEPQRVLGARVLAWPADGNVRLHLEAGELHPGDSGRSVALELGDALQLDARIARVHGADLACTLAPAARAQVHAIEPGAVVVLRLRG
jgi:ferredoxin